MGYYVPNDSSNILIIYGRIIQPYSVAILDRVPADLDIFTAEIPIDPPEDIPFKEIWIQWSPWIQLGRDKIKEARNIIIHPDDYAILPPETKFKIRY